MTVCKVAGPTLAPAAQRNPDTASHLEDLGTSPPCRSLSTEERFEHDMDVLANIFLRAFTWVSITDVCHTILAIYPRPLRKKIYDAFQYSLATNTGGLTDVLMRNTLREFARGELIYRMQGLHLAIRVFHNPSSLKNNPYNKKPVAEAELTRVENGPQSAINTFRAQVLDSIERKNHIFFRNESILENAVNARDLVTVSEVMRSFRVSQKELDLTLQAAAREGHQQLVEFLLGTTLSDGSRVSQEGLHRALVEAAWMGHQQLVELLLRTTLSDGSSVSQKGLQRALKVAAVEGHQQLVKLLLRTTLSDRSSVSQKELDQALQDAALRGNQQLVELLLGTTLSDGSSVSQKGLDQALQDATWLATQQIVELLLGTTLPDGSRVSQEGLHIALREAARNGKQQIVELFNSSFVPSP